MTTIGMMIGKVITDVLLVDANGWEHDGEYNDSITFVFSDGSTFWLGHNQDCCEHVWIEDIAGDLKDLSGSAVTQAELSTNESMANYGTETWSFYKIGTANGGVTIRWCGSSNGYYSESVDELWDSIKEE